MNATITTKNRLMSIKKTDKFLSEIIALGYKESSMNGSSHRIFKHAELPTLSIHHKREIAPGTRRNLVKLILGKNYYG